MKQERVRTQALTAVSLLLSSLVLVTTAGCKKEEPPPPLPAAAPATTPPAPLELAPEPEAAPPPEPTATEVKKGSGVPGPSLKNCCSALRQNAKSAPPPNNQYMEQAASVCDALVVQGQQKQSIVAAIQGALKGAGLPAACQ